MPQNLACVVAGRRRFTLFPPDQVGNLYVGPLDRTLAGQPSSLADIEEPDFERFPRLAQAFEAALTAELAPGDVLYIPSMWWHAVQSLEPVGAMVNYWWRDGPADQPSPIYALKHALMVLGDLPPAERQAWQALFARYVLPVDRDMVAAHIPPSARGVLGDLSANRRTMLKDEIATALRR